MNVLLVYILRARSFGVSVLLGGPRRWQMLSSSRKWTRSIFPVTEILCAVWVDESLRSITMRYASTIHRRVDNYAPFDHVGVR